MVENTFRIGDLEFSQAPLKMREALKAQGLCLEAFLPPILAAGGDMSGLPDALAGFGKIDQLVDLFLAVCKVKQGNNFVALGPFADAVFARRSAALLAWLAACIEWQFADFFDGTGLPLLAGQVNQFLSRIGSTGGSGGS